MKSQSFKTALLALILVWAGDISLAAPNDIWINGLWITDSYSVSVAVESGNAEAKTTIAPKPTGNLVMPEIPLWYVSNGIVDYVIAEVSISESGAIAGIKITSAPDVEGGKAVRTALSKWTFLPARSPERNGKALPFQLTVRFDFGIKEKVRGSRIADEHAAPNRWKE